MFLRSMNLRRYRGIEALEWQPNPGVNCIVGPGDSGKSTILAAISLLLTPRPVGAASEYDFHRRRLEEGFEITAVIGGLDDAVISAMRVPALRGWKDGQVLDLPDEEGAEPVLVARVIGSPELEVRHELLPPSGEPFQFSVAVRQRLFLSRVSGEERAGRELRLGQGSLLERHIGEIDFRPALSAAVATASANLQLPEEANQSLEKLRMLFGKAGLPKDLQLGIIAPQGSSLLGMVGLLSGDPGEAVPLAYAGTGTKQLALFLLTAALVKAEPVLVLDEPETGLEPYRQRSTVSELRKIIGKTGQAFLATHSPAILEAMQPGEIWRLAPGGNPVRLDDASIIKSIDDAPDAMLSRVPVLCEGATEAGLLRPLLDDLASKSALASIDSLGIRLVARTGQPMVLEEAEAMLKAGIPCGVFVDCEQRHSGKRQALKEQEACAFSCWEGVRNIEEAVARWVPWEKLQDIVALAASLQEQSVESLLQQVGERAGKPGKSTLQDLAGQVGDECVRDALAKAMEDRVWFKSEDRGASLGRRLLEMGIPGEINAHISSFWSRLLALLR